MRSGGRRGIAALLMWGALGLSGCGQQESADVAVGTATPTPTGRTPSATATYEPPELDRTDLDAHLAALSPTDRALVDHYLGTPLGEGTWIVAAPMTVAEARTRLLGPSPRRATEADERAMMDASISAYSFLQVGDGVVAFEDTGFADPPKRLLAELSRDGAVSAVATDNIEAMTRFGYARDGEIVFDAFEYAFVDDIDEIPAEVRDLARLAWDDLEGPMVETASWFDVAMAMSEKVTGVRARASVSNVEDLYVVPLPWGVMEDY
ncbi:hypothetical protein SAMN05192575_101850 [Nocardioides alpinus]|uniref:Uncharacterized protein n=1 Tax=Nocardioides alpinus TaxID=748909 RepID=A0A1I0WAH2_9ACTN|nr:DUF6461 domain-containing protein [Nocardioides alpinus]PKH37801.1 hypothetical protein CXG46_20605 [Nocardioides alpinus]SFA85719.1 hypothetical protein SAMN05192575_101850 [Nocardioides alpinus]